jgi:EpsI family protein
MTRRNYITIILLLLITAFFSWKFYFSDYRQPQAFDIYTFPKQIGPWKSQELPILDKSVIGSNSVLSRRYEAFGKHVDLYIVYSQNNPKAIRPPEISYTNVNFSILDKGKKSIKISALNYDFKINWLLLDKDQGQEIVYFWFKGGGIFTSSYWKQQFLIAFNNIAGQKTGSALVQISTDLGSQSKNSIAIVNEFITLIIPLLSEYLP